MRKLFLFFIVALLCSCQIQYDVSTRYVFEGQVKDRYGNSIENNIVEAWIHNEHDHDLIGYTTTDSNGLFQMVIPEPINEDDFEIEFTGNTDYQEKMYMNIFKSDFKDFYFNVGEVTLIKNDDITQLEIVLNQINSENVILNMELSGLFADRIIWVNDPYPENPITYNLYRDVAKNQILNLHYEVRNSNTLQTEAYDELISIDDESVEYTITY